MTVFRNPFSVGALLAFSFITGACTSSSPNSKPTDSLIGSLAKGIFGSSQGTSATIPVGKKMSEGSGITGALAGALAEAQIARFLSSLDLRKSREAEFKALEYGRSGARVPWKNPSTGIGGEVVPGINFVQKGKNCRRYTHTVAIDGRRERVRGTACRRADGSWFVPPS